MNARAIVTAALASRGKPSPAGLDSLQMVDLLLDIEGSTGLDLDETAVVVGINTDQLVTLVENALKASARHVA
jgi:acyl carrier protein